MLGCIFGLIVLAVVVALVLMLVWYIIKQLPIPPDFRWVANVFFALICIAAVFGVYSYWSDGGICLHLGSGRL